MKQMDVHIGVDVGGTNTDAVVLHGTDVLGSAKQFTTPDVTTGVSCAIRTALDNAINNTQDGKVRVLRVHIGTTHFVNAIVQKHDLARVSVIRLCGPASRALPPFSEFPADLKQAISASIYMINGGFEFDGISEIKPVDEDEVQRTIEDIKAKGITNVVISGIFSVVNSSHELRVRKLFRELYPSASLTLSHNVGQMGILERENAAILNESLKPLCQRTVATFRDALDRLGLTCPFYMTQNDGTLISAEQTLEQPIHTFASGPTNSMRGAAFLSGVNDAVVVDIGGTTTDVGMLISGFPREASTKVKVGNVPTNFHMPDVISFGLGGGSIVQIKGQNVNVGPHSVGYQLANEGIVYGGETLTASDVAVKAGLAKIGNPELVESLDSNMTETVLMKMNKMVQDVIDQIKISEEAVPVILVGGGSILMGKASFTDTTDIIQPPHFEVANAVGAALSQVSGTVDYTVSLDNRTHDEVIRQAKVMATQAAIQAGAMEHTVEITDIMEVPLTGNATRVKVKAVGDLKLGTDQEGVWWTGESTHTICEQHITGVLQTHTATGIILDDDKNLDVIETGPNIDPSTGEWHLTEWDIECIAIGAGILGTGGGGSTNNVRLRCRKALKEGKQIRVITPERLVCGPKDIILPVALMGAPTIVTERLTSNTEIPSAIEAMCNLYSIGGFTDPGKLTCMKGIEIKTGEGLKYIDDYKPPKRSGDQNEGPRICALMCVEIGGSNSMEPLVAAAEMGLPVVDCDFMGRAFPELQMTTNMIYGMPPYPAILADHNGRQAAALYAQSAKHLENHLRNVCIQMGCIAAFVERPLNRDQVLEKTVLYSLSRAWRLGQAVLNARKQNLSPIDAILHHEGGKLLIIGKICDVIRQTTGGFARGELQVEGYNQFHQQRLIVQFQNETLVASTILPDNRKQVQACVPDLISLVDVDTGEPIPTEELRYGMWVAVLAMAASPRLTTPQALISVGPQAFGYSPDEVTFTPCGQYMDHEPVPPVHSCPQSKIM